MSEFSEAIHRKISELVDEREELLDAVARIEQRLEVLGELLVEETEDPSEPAPEEASEPKPSAKKKRGRPKGSKSKKTTKKKQAAEMDDMYEEALRETEKRGGGTTPEQQARLGRGTACQKARPSPDDPGVTKETAVKGRDGKANISIG